MSVEQRLMDDLKQAMRAGDVERREAIRMLRAAVKNEEIALQHPLSEVEFVGVVNRLVKRHRESIDQFEKGNRPDLVIHEQAQLAALSPYLPTLMSREEIAAVVREVMAEVNAEGPRAQGQIMAALAPRLRGKADMKEVSAVVQSQLTAS
jgi:hypothetical protein